VRGPRHRSIIGIDVGGTKIAAAAVDPVAGTVAHRHEIATHPERHAADVIADIAGLAEVVAADLAKNGTAVTGIGIGVPELVDAQGRIRSAYLLDWSTLALDDRLAEFAPVRLSSDVRAAALAEATFGAGRPYRLFVYVSIGTGISSSLVLDGLPLAGARGGAVVLSTAPLSIPCNGCGDWSEFVLEDFASGRALARRFSDASGKATASALDVVRAAAQGDRDAIAVVDSAAYALGSAVGWLVNVLDPEALIIGGGLGRTGGLYWDCLVQSTRAHIWNEEARELPILPAALGPDAGVIGAALAAQSLTPALSRENPHPYPSPTAVGEGPSPDDAPSGSPSRRQHTLSRLGRGLG
jgi:glucokinase